MRRGTQTPLLLEGFRHKADSKYGLFGLIQKLQLPFGVLFEIACNAANEVAAHLGHLIPSGITVREVEHGVRRSGSPTTLNTQIKDRHFKDIPFLSARKCAASR